MSKRVVVLADLTALFFTREKYRKNIDYKAIDTWLKKVMNTDKLSDVSKFFTLFNSNNQKQTDFIQFLKTQLGWDVVGVKTSEIRSGIDFKHYRFDSRIAFELGYLLADSDADQTDVVVISDSFELLSSMSELTKFEDINVHLAFFSDALDGKWWKILNDEQNKIKFLDFEKISYSEDNSTVE